MQSQGIREQVSLSEADMAARITVELGPAIINGEGALSNRLKHAAAASGNTLLREALLSSAARLESIELRGDPSSLQLIENIERAGKLSCVYYPCGTCLGDSAMVCCYYDAESPPVCWCEAC